MLGRILSIAWGLLILNIVLLLALPALRWLPGPPILLIWSLLLILVSGVYGISVLYRSGTKRHEEK